MKDQIKVLRENEKSVEEVEENFETARKMYLEKEKELEKLRETHAKDMGKEGLDRMKLEDSVRRVTQENERLKNKDETYFSIFECLNQFLDSKGFKISKVGEVNDAHVTQGCREEMKQQAKTKVIYVCKECEQETNSKEELETHKRNSHKITHKCNVCSFKTDVEAEFAKHKTSAHLKIIFKCQVRR